MARGKPTLVPRASRTVTLPLSSLLAGASRVSSVSRNPEPRSDSTCDGAELPPFRESRVWVPEAHPGL